MYPQASKKDIQISSLFIFLWVIFALLDLDLHPIAGLYPAN